MDGQTKCPNCGKTVRAGNYNTTTEIQLDDLGEALKKPGDENGVTAKAALDTIESLLKKNALAEIPTNIGIDGVLLRDVVKIVPSVDWIGKDAYLELTFHAGICESAQMVTATVTFPLHDESRLRLFERRGS
jgi:hypothetical protein